MSELPRSKLRGIQGQDDRRGAASREVSDLKRMKKASKGISARCAAARCPRSSALPMRRPRRG